MKNKWFLLILATALIVSCLLAAGCSQPREDSSAVRSASVPVRDVPLEISSQSNPLEYFPMDTGAEWTYYIMPGEVSPVNYEKIFIVEDKQIYAFQYRNIIHAQPGQVYVLKIRVKGPFRGGQRFNSVELEVLKDEIGFFKDTTGVFWGIMDNPTGQGLKAMELASSYSADKLIVNYPSLGLEKANLLHSYRIIFIWDGYKFEAEKGESISYLGVDNNVIGYGGTPCYHFLREVPAAGTDPNFKAFTEDTWYAKGKGMVRLEQKIDGRTSMVWTLEKFIPGGK
ncbi:MAG: hypothetical protein NTZ84_03520 [Candidatus Nealsonbacteria bacterium]|nr:hypothetical protein [Candidatus Nealsonbacteria bacterium]